MSHRLIRYELSLEADQDLSDIFDYTQTEFGQDQAIIYLRDLDDCFTTLLNHPESGRKRPEIREGLYSLASGSHVVFYRILADRLRIVRVLHGSRDLPRLFEL